MNGEAPGGGGDGGGGSIGGRGVVTSQPAPGTGASTFLRTGSTPSAYSSSPRLRRLEDMKKSYLSSSGGGGGGGGGSAPSNPSLGYNTTFTSKYSTSTGNSYRLASLDRLAQRHKLYDTNGLANEANANAANAANINSGGVTPRDVRDSPRDPPPAVANNIPPSGQPPVISKLVKELVKETRRPREVDGYVGFANLPNQVFRKAVKKAFEFSLMVVGESGLGKSTLINSMFLSDIYSNEYPGPSHRVKKTVQVETTKVLLKENGVNLMLTVVDTPGFGDAVDNSDCWQPVTDYVETKYEEYLNCESKVNRTQISDTRVHCCLYFIAPSGHGLKPLDVEFMKRLHDKVNIIPVIAKADTLTTDECQHLKKQVLNEIAQHKIKIYEFPDEEGDAAALKLKQRVPFAVVGSNTIVEIDGKKSRGRKYPWGIVEVENMDHCDFIPLRNMMIRTHMQDLKDVTNNVHYENYRCRKLAGIGGTDGKVKITNKNPITQMEEEKTEHTNRMKKMEAEMEQVFEMKVKEKMSKLTELEADLQKRNESMRKKLEADTNELEEERERFERERKAWENANNITVEELRRKSLESISREHVDGKEKPKKKKGLF